MLAIADAAELQAAEQEAEREAGWEDWLSTRLTAERERILEIVTEATGKAIADVRTEIEGKVVTRELDQERAARQRDRSRAFERLKSQRQAHAERVAALETKIDTQHRAIGLLEIKLHKTRTETARRAETEEATAVMMRSLYERMLER